MSCELDIVQEYYDDKISVLSNKIEYVDYLLNHIVRKPHKRKLFIVEKERLIKEKYKFENGEIGKWKHLWQ